MQVYRLKIFVFWANFSVRSICRGFELVACISSLIDLQIFTLPAESWLLFVIISNNLSFLSNSRFSHQLPWLCFSYLFTCFILWDKMCEKQMFWHNVFFISEIKTKSVCTTKDSSIDDCVVHSGFLFYILLGRFLLFTAWSSRTHCRYSWRNFVSRSRFSNIFFRYRWLLEKYICKNSSEMCIALFYLIPFHPLVHNLILLGILLLIESSLFHFSGKDTI